MNERTKSIHSLVFLLQKNKLKFSEGFYNAYDKTGIVLIIVAMAVTALGSVVRDRVTA